MTSKSLTDLAERVERASGADRELDQLVAKAVGYRDIHGDGSLWDRGNDGYWIMDNTDSAGMQELPRFTASLDAAMSLVPEGPLSALGERVSIGVWDTNGVYPEHVRATAWVIGAPRVYAATPALALCAAALRSRAMMADDTAQPTGQSPPIVKG